MARTQVNKKEEAVVDRLRRGELIAAAHGVIPPDPDMRIVSALKNGVMASRLLDNNERDVFYALIERFYAEYTLNTSADFMEVELVNLLFIQFFRAVQAADWDAAHKIDSMLRAHLREMKASKRSREGDETQRQMVSAGEWTADLLAKARGTGMEIGMAVAAAPSPA